MIQPSAYRDLICETKKGYPKTRGSYTIGVRRVRCNISEASSKSYKKKKKNQFFCSLQ
uniref:Uncharacterized protein n=1 Tax=Rhizophora mucronata TaxID=61149 RepID=A0A2P2PP17_RHIMU